MSSVEKVVEQSLLYDYYGELLTSHQRKIYEAAVFENLSLGEIAEEAGISRQGVYDLLKRCDGKLKQYEASLHLMEKQERVRKLAESMDEAVTELSSMCSACCLLSERTTEHLPANSTAQEQPGDPEAQKLTAEQTFDRLQQLVHQLLEEI